MKNEIKPLDKIIITDPIFQSQEQVGQTLTVVQDLGEFWIAKSNLGAYYRVEKWQARIVKEGTKE